MGRIAYNSFGPCIGHMVWPGSPQPPNPTFSQSSFRSATLSADDAAMGKRPKVVLDQGWKLKMSDLGTPMMYHQNYSIYNIYIGSLANPSMKSAHGWTQILQWFNHHQIVQNKFHLHRQNWSRWKKWFGMQEGGGTFWGDWLGFQEAQIWYQSSAIETKDNHKVSGRRSKWWEEHMKCWDCTFKKLRHGLCCKAFLVLIPFYLNSAAGIPKIVVNNRAVTRCLVAAKGTAWKHPSIGAASQVGPRIGIQCHW